MLPHFPSSGNSLTPHLELASFKLASFETPSETGWWSQSQSYVTTDGQSASLSWCQASIWGVRPDFYYCQTISGLLTWGALSDERTGLPFTIAADPRKRSHSSVWVPRDSWPYFTLIFETPPTRSARCPYLYPPGTGWPSYTPKHWVPFPSPPTILRATVEVFEPASTQGWLPNITTVALYNLRATVFTERWRRWPHRKQVTWFLASEFIGALLDAQQRATNSRNSIVTCVLTCLLSRCLATLWPYKVQYGFTRWPNLSLKQMYPV
jgi:hypothetical protein